jgi:hypothetical protein
LGGHGRVCWPVRPSKCVKERVVRTGRLARYGRIDPPKADKARSRVSGSAGVCRGGRGPFDFAPFDRTQGKQDKPFAELRTSPSTLLPSTVLLRRIKLRVNRVNGRCGLSVPRVALRRRG